MSGAMRKIGERLFYYSYLRDIGRTYNRNVLLRRNLTGSKWVGKISNSLFEKGVDFRDLNSRAVLAHRLATLIGANVLAFRLIPAKRIVGLDLENVPHRIDDFIFLTPWSGGSIPEFLSHGQLEDLRNPAEILDNFVFNVWIGNYDRKDGDYLVSHDRNVYCIDYHLCGPGFDRDYLLSLGAYAEAYSIDDPNDTGWCIGSPVLLQWIRNKKATLEEFLPAIERIEQLRDADIQSALRNLRFCDEHNREMTNDIFLDFLLKRRYLVRHAVEEWIAEGYPKSQRPKDPRHADNIYRDIA